MLRRDLLATLAAPLAATAQEVNRTRGLPPLTIKNVRIIPTSGGGRYQWVFVKIETSEPGLYGLGSASNVNNAFSVVSAIEKHYAPFWIGKDVARIEDNWQNTHVRSYWRNGTIHNNVLSALDMALWDIKGKRAGMPVYDLLGGKARDAVPMYAHADGRDLNALTESARKYIEEGYRHVRVQLGGYGGGGMIAPGQGSRPATGFRGVAFDEELYVDVIPKMFEHLRVKLGNDVKLCHDVHEHLTPIMAVELSKRCEPYRLFFLEDVLAPEQIQWFRNIRQVCTTPMAMGELFTHPLEWVPLISERLIDFFRGRVSQIGGITAAKKVAALCETFGCRTAFQEGGDNDPVNQLAAYHVDLSISSFGIQEENHFPRIVHDMLPGTAVLKGGYLYGSDKPGLGIEINEALAAKHPLVPPPGGDSWTTVRGMDGSLVKP
ncbi:MAG: mandelate racemase [Acidobacteria bacterium]|nr:mandelate racemase [Acidobacteriota bacterium]